MRFSISSVFLVFMMFLSACEPEPQPEKKKKKKKMQPEHSPTFAVCIWDGASVRQGPSAEAKWITSLSLGEKLTWLGIEKPDSAKPERYYYKIMLSDSTIGWSSEYVIVEGEPGVIVSQTPVFKRPDLITMTETQLMPMSFVAVTESEGEWVSIVGNQNKPRGWIKLDAVSLKADDVAIGVIFTKLQGSEDKQEKYQKLQTLINNPVFENSVFIDDLKKELGDFESKD